MNLTAPYGYGEIVPLQKEHRVLLPSGNTPSFCRGINALAVSVGEFVAAGRDYPLVFVAVAGSFAPVVALGLADGANLFVDAAGEWERGAYFPAYLRRFPFCLSKVYVDGEPNGERLVCVARSYVDAAGVQLFDADGRPSERWQAAERLLVQFEADLDRTAQFCDALARLELLEPFSLQVNDRPGVRLAGMYRVAEPRLGALRPANLKALLDKGFLGLLYAHLHSLENFSRLVARLPAAGRG